jgi:hypothetical protein
MIAFHPRGPIPRKIFFFLHLIGRISLIFRPVCAGSGMTLDRQDIVARKARSRGLPGLGTRFILLFSDPLKFV